MGDPANGFSLLRSQVEAEGGLVFAFAEAFFEEPVGGFEGEIAGHFEGDDAVFCSKFVEEGEEFGGNFFDDVVGRVDEDDVEGVVGWAPVDDV